MIVVMPVVEIVWRRLLVGAREGRRRWSSASTLAAELGIPVSTAHRSIEHPVEIGAVSVRPLEGLQVLDPYRLLMLFAAHRRLQRDVVERLTVAASTGEVEHLVAQGRDGVLGGFGALVRHLGSNRIADYGTVLVYGDPGIPRLPDAPDGEGTEVLVAEPDRWLAGYGRITPLAQAYADLFSLPGWQAARFIDQLDPRQIAASDEPVLLV